jgi:hypothetical protein
VAHGEGVEHGLGGGNSPKRGVHGEAAMVASGGGVPAVAGFQSSAAAEA